MHNYKPNEKKLVLVVDDDPSVRESVAELLETKGYAVLQAENGQRALDLLRKTPHLPSVVLLDLAMPIMDGHRFLEIRAEDPELREIPVVVASGAPLSLQLFEGIDAYLGKPVNVDRLIAVIDQHC